MSADGNTLGSLVDGGWPLRARALLAVATLVAVASSCSDSHSSPIEQTSGVSQADSAITFTISLPAGVPLHTVLLGASGTLTLRPNLALQGPGGVMVALTNTGASGTDIGSNDQVQSLWSQSPVTLHQGVQATGGVTSASTVTEDNKVTVAGGVTQNATMSPFQKLSWTVHVPSPGASVDVGPGATQSISPASYGDVVVEPKATLQLAAGTYYFGSLQTLPGSTLSIDVSGGSAQLYVMAGLDLKGTMNAGGHEHSVLLGYAGSDSVLVHSPFAGTLVAPAASLQLQPVGGTGYRGSFFAQNIDVQPGSPLTIHRPSGAR